MKKILIIIGFSILLPGFLIAETNSQVQGIQEKLQNATGVERVNLLISLSKAYRTISYHDCLKYGEESIKEAKRLNNPDLAGLASKDLGVSSYFSADYKNALQYFKEGLSLYKESKNKKGISNCLNDIGLIYESWSQFDEAANYYQQSLDIEKELSNPEGIATSLINVGNINYYRKAYRHALENYMGALKIFIDLKDPDGMGSAYNSVAVIYEQLDEYDKASDFLQKAKEIYENQNDKMNLSKVLDNLADIYNEHFKDYKKSLLMYEQALDLKRDIDSKSGIALVKCNLGALYGKLGNFSKAFELLGESKKQYEQIGDMSGQVMVYYNEGSILILAREFRKALTEFRKGAKLAEQIGYTDYSQKINEGFFICYAGLGDFENFSKYYGTYSASRDSLIKKLEIEHTTEIENQFNVKELTQKSNQLKEKSQYQSQMIKSYDLILAIAIGAVLILLITAIFYRKIRKKARYVKDQQ